MTTAYIDKNVDLKLLAIARLYVQAESCSEFELLRTINGLLPSRFSFDPFYWIHAFNSFSMSHARRHPFKAFLDNHTSWAVMTALISAIIPIAISFYCFFPDFSRASVANTIFWPAVLAVTIFLSLDALFDRCSNALAAAYAALDLAWIQDHRKSPCSLYKKVTMCNNDIAYAAQEMYISISF